MVTRIFKGLTKMVQKAGSAFLNLIRRAGSAFFKVFRQAGSVLSGLHQGAEPNKKQRINIAVFALCLFCIGIANLFTENIQISEQENRVLEQRPEFQVDRVFSGEYFKDFENYFADQFLSREAFVQISSKVKEAKGLPGAQDVQIVTAGGFNAFEEHAAANQDELAQSGPPMTDETTIPGVPNELSEGTATSNAPAEPREDTTTPVVSTGETGSQENVPVPTNRANIPIHDATNITDMPTGNVSDKTDKSTNASADVNSATPQQSAAASEKKTERDDNGKTINKVLIHKDSAYALFPFSEDSGNYYASTLNQFLNRAGDGITAYSLLTPTNTEFIGNEKFQALSDSQKGAIDHVNARLKGVVPVDAYTALQAHKDEYIYFRTDHHWTALGAYYAYTGFCAAAGLEPVPLEKYDTEKIEGYVGSMYETTGSSNLKRNPDTITVYKPFIENEYHVWYGSPVKLNLIDMSHADKKVKYRVFLSGDRPLGVIKTEITNGKKILVIKDSYGNAMVPFLVPHYEEIYVVDPRQYEKNIFSLIQKNEIQEVLFLNYVPILSYYGYIDLVVKVMDAEG